MNNIDGIVKIPKNELNKKRDIILGMIGEGSDSNESASQRKEISNVGIDINHGKIANNKKSTIKEKDREKEAHILKNTPNKHKEKKEKEIGKLVKQKELSMGEVSIPEKDPRKEVAVVAEQRQKTKHKKKSSHTAVLKILKTRFLFLQSKIKKAMEKIAFVLVVSFFTTAIIYFILFLIIVNYQVDNHFFRFIEKKLPVPAMIVDSKFISYYDYADLKKNSGAKKETEVRYELIRSLIADNFFNKYHTSDLSTLNKLIVNDNEVNNVGLSRIRKIKQLVDNGEDFDKIIGKYGEKRESITLSGNGITEYEHYERIKDLSAGQISNIVFTDDSYLIFRCNEKSDNKISLSYVLVYAKSFDKYVDEITKSVYFVSFVE